MAYEYRLVQLRHGPEGEAEFNDLGARGWNIAGISDGIAVFHRRAPKCPAPDVPWDDPGRCEIEKG